jgi:putative ABC transport system permease protein
MALPLYYNWRNLFVRKLSTLLTFVIVTVVVAVLAVLLSFSEGIRVSLKSTGSPLNVIVLQTGATAESTSIIKPDEVGRIMQVPGIARSAGGEVLCSQELCVQTSIPRVGPAATPANVAVRGVDKVAFETHSEVRLIDGRVFSEGAHELIVGKAAMDRFRNTKIGDMISLGRVADKPFRVVGIFDAKSGALESEIWGPRSMIADVYHRFFISSACLRLTDPSSAVSAIEYICGPSVRMNAKRETDYYKDLSTKTTEIVILTTILMVIMGIGASFAVANTMYASVDGRRREIAMLRTIGFGRWSIISSFVIEAFLICMLACIVGLSLAMLLNGSRKDFLSDTTWTVLAYELRITPTTIISAISLAMLVAIGGAVAPALRASRIRVIEALRKG